MELSWTNDSLLSSVADLLLLSAITLTPLWDDDNDDSWDAMVSPVLGRREAFLLEESPVLDRLDLLRLAVVLGALVGAARRPRRVKPPAEVAVLVDEFAFPIVDDDGIDDNDDLSCSRLSLLL